MKKLQRQLLSIHEDGEHPVYHIMSLINEIHMMGKFSQSAMRDLGYNVKNNLDGIKGGSGTGIDILIDKRVFCRHLDTHATESQN